MSFSEFVRQSRRIMYAFHKPTWSELKQTAFVTGTTSIILGIVGVIVSYVIKFILTL